MTITIITVQMVSKMFSTICNVLVTFMVHYMSFFRHEFCIIDVNHITLKNVTNHFVF